MDHKKLSRRSFLAFSSLAAGALVAACATPTASPTTAPAATQPPAAKATEAPKPTTAPAATTAAGTTPAATAATGAATPTTAAKPTAAPAGPTATLKPGALNTPTPEPTPVIAQVAVKPGQVKVDWWTPRGGAVDLQAEGEAADKFNKSQDKVVVQIVYVPTTAGTQMSEKLLTSIAGGTPPHSSEFDRFIVSSWAAQGALTDLSDRAKASSIVADQFYPFAWEEASYKGKLYAMPQDTDTRGIYYNMELLDKAGVKPPTTIAELDAAAEKLSIKEGRQFKQWGYSPFYNQSFHYAVALQFGGPSYDKMYDKATNKCTANAEVNVEAFNWIKTYADKYNIQDLEAFQSAFGTQTNDPFLSGQISMYAQGDWGLANIKKFKPDMKFDVVPMPGKSGPAPCMAGGWSEVLPKGAKNQDEGWAWISFYGGPEGQLIYNKGTMHIPTNIKASQDKAFTEDPKHAKFMDFLKIALNRPAIPAGQMLWNELGAAQSAVTHNTKTPKQALDDVKVKVDAELAKYP